MKLCQKCLDAILHSLKSKYDSDLRRENQVVPESDCEFWAHEMLRDALRWWTLNEAAEHAESKTDFPNGQEEHEKWLMARLEDGTWNT